LKCFSESPHGSPFITAIPPEKNVFRLLAIGLILVLLKVNLGVAQNIQADWTTTIRTTQKIVEDPKYRDLKSHIQAFEESRKSPPFSDAAMQTLWRGYHDYRMAFLYFATQNFSDCIRLANSSDQEFRRFFNGPNVKVLPGDKQDSPAHFYAKLLLLRGKSYRQFSSYEEAQEDFLAADQLWTQTLISVRDSAMMDARFELGFLAFLRGDFDTCEAEYTRMAKELPVKFIPESAIDRNILAQKLADLNFQRGVLEHERRQFDLALVFYDKADAEEAKLLEKDQRLKPFIARDRARTLRDKAGAPSPLLNQSIRLFEQLRAQDQGKPRGESLHMVRVLAGLAGAHYMNRDYKTGEKTFRDALALLDKLDSRNNGLTDNSVERLTLQRSLAGMYVAAGQYEKAAGTMHESRVANLKYVTTTLASQPAEAQRDFLNRKDKLTMSAIASIALADPNNPRVCESTLECIVNGKGMLLPLLTTTQRLLKDPAIRVKPGVGEAADRLLNLQKQLAFEAVGPRDAGFAERLASTQKQRRDAERAVSQLISNDIRIAALRPWLTIQELRNGLSATDALIVIYKADKVDLKSRGIDWQVSGSRYVAWVLTKTGNAQVVDIGNAAEIDGDFLALKALLLQQNKKLGPENVEERAKAYDTHPALDRLSARLVAPLSKLLPNATHWLISPDGAAWDVPFGVFKAGNAFLAEICMFTYLMSGREIVERTARPRPQASAVFAPIRFGSLDAEKDPPILSKGAKLFVDLPNTESEARFASESLTPEGGKAQLLINEEANEANFLRLKSPEVLHLATHAFFKRDESLTSVLRCGVVFHDANTTTRNRYLGQSINPNQDGLVMGIEVLGMDFRGTRLVVLSACESAEGDLQKVQKSDLSKVSDDLSEGVVGLRYVFLGAGAREVLSTAWEVIDSETALLNEYFYDASKDKNYAKALFEAQKKLIADLRGRFGDTAHPLMWGAITLTRGE
jgi:CHAT domain-containing protein/tetratricopeptide (TPR) repeat protein